MPVKCEDDMCNDLVVEYLVKKELSVELIIEVMNMAKPFGASQILGRRRF